MVAREMGILMILKWFLGKELASS